MNHSRSALAAGLLALLTVAPAAAQQFPTVPAQSVIGRLGLPGDSGPSQPIALTTFFSRLLSGGVLQGLALPSVNASSDLVFYDISPMGVGQGGRIGFGGKFNTTNALAEWAAIGAPKANSTANDSTASLAFYLRSSLGGPGGDKWGAPQMTLSQPGLLTLTTSGVKQLGILDPTKQLIVDGSSAAPVTSLGPTVLVSRYENQASFGSQNAAIYGTSVGAATSNGQPVAIQGYAYNLGTSDVNALFGRAEQHGTGGKAAIGGFTNGLAFSSGSSAEAFEFETTNHTGQDAPYFADLSGKQVFMGLDNNYDGTAGALGTAGIVVRSINGKWDVGLGFQRFGGNSPTRTADIQTDSDAVTILLGNSGAHTNGIDLTGGGSTYSGSAFKSPGFNVAGTGTVTISPSAGATQGLMVAQPGLSGTVAGTVTTASGGNPAFAYNQTFIINDSASVTGATDPKFTYGDNIAMVTGGAGATGGKIALNAFLYKSTSSAPSTARDHVALNAHGLIDAGDGGTGTALGQSKGTMFGAGISAVARSGALNIFELAGIEIDAALQTGSSATYRFGLNIVDTGNLQAIVQDAAIAIGGGVSAWRTGLLFSDLNGGMPVSSTGTLIKADTSTVMTVDSVMDFGTNVSITNYLLRGPGGYIDKLFNFIGPSATLGGPGLSSGVILAKGTTSGTASIVVQAAQGTPSITIPTGSGTIVTSVTPPIVIDPVTGRISCPTCSTTSGGGAIATLAFGTHLTSGGSSYNGSAGVTITSDATNANTASAIVARDGSGNFSAGTITASLTGHASLDLALTGGTMSGAIAMGANNITGAANVAASTFNGNTFTTGTGVLTIAASKTLTASNTLTFTGTDGSSVAFGTGGTVLYGNQTITLSGDASGSGTTAITTTLTTAQPAVHTWALAQTFTVAPVFTDQSGSRTALGLGTMATQAASSVAVTGGTLAGLTGLAIRDTSAAFDLTFAATSSPALTAGRALTLNMGNVAHTLALGTTAGTITFPNTAADTVAMLAVAQTFTAQPTISVAASTQLAAKSTGANNSYITIDTSQATLQSGFQLSSNGSAKWQFIKQTDESFLIFDNANSIVAASITPGATTVGSVNFGYTTASTSSTTGSVKVAGGLGAVGAIYGGAEIATGATVVGSLPTCNAAHKAARHFVTDANATFTAGIGAVVAGSGANNVPVTCDGTNWRIGANDNIPLQQMRKFA